MKVVQEMLLCFALPGGDWPLPGWLHLIRPSAGPHLQWVCICICHEPSLEPLSLEPRILPARRGWTCTAQ